MKLYRIIVLHGAPKDSHTSTETYLVASDDKQVAKWIDKEKNFGAWFEDEDPDDPRMRFADDDCEKEIPFAEWVMQERGDLADDEGWEDAYYGVTKWGWEEVSSATPEDIDRLVALKIAVKA